MNGRTYYTERRVTLCFECVPFGMRDGDALHVAVQHTRFCTKGLRAQHLLQGRSADQEVHGFNPSAPSCFQIVASACCQIASGKKEKADTSASRSARNLGAPTACTFQLATWFSLVFVASMAKDPRSNS